MFFTAPSTSSGPATIPSETATVWWEDPPLPQPAWSSQDYFHRLAVQSQEFNRVTLQTLSAIQMPASTSSPLYPSVSAGSAARDIHNSAYSTSTLPFPGTMAAPSSVPTSTSGTAPGSWMAGYSASLGMLDDGSRAAMVWPPSNTQAVPTLSHSPGGGTGYPSPGATSRRARIQKVHHPGTVADQSPYRRGYQSPASTRYVEEAHSSSVMPPSSEEEEKPEIDNDPEYVDKDYSSADADYIEPAPATASSARNATQTAIRGKKRKSADSSGGSGRSSGQAKVFQCTGFGECNMVFSRSEHLARHIRKHTGERPFKCRCGRAFSRLDNLRQHTQTVHHDQPKKNAEMLERLASVHANLSASASRVHKGISVALSVARNANSSSSSKSSSSSVSSEGTVKRRAAQKAEAILDEMTVEEEIAHAMARRSASVHPPPLPEHTYFPASHYTHRGSGSSESTTSEFSISPSTPATRLPWLSSLGPQESYDYRPYGTQAGPPRYVVSMSAPPPATEQRDKEGYITLPPIRPARPLLPPMGALLPAPTDRLYPASFPPTNYPISPYFANASQAAWRAGLSYATAANTYIHSRPLEYAPAPGLNYDYRDYIVNQEEEGSANHVNDQYRTATAMREVVGHEGYMARSASLDDSPPSFEAPHRGTSSEESLEVLHESVQETDQLSHNRANTLTQEDVTGERLPNNATGSTSNDPYHWHMPLVSGLEYFAGHSRAISAERSTTTPLIPQVIPSEEGIAPVQHTEKMSLKTLCAPNEEVTPTGLVAEDAIFDEKDFHMTISD